MDITTGNLHKAVLIGKIRGGGMFHFAIHTVLR